MSRSQCTVLLVGLSIAAIVMSGCRRSSPPAPKAQVYPGAPVGASPSVPPKPGEGVDWTPGAHPPGPNSVRLIGRINTRRAELKLVPLIWHGGLKRVAWYHTNHITKPTLVASDGIDVYTRMVSSNPPIVFTSAQALVTKLSNADDIDERVSATYRALMNNSTTRALIESPTMTHYGSWFHGHGQLGTIIFGQNVTP